jgi:hypothetical protein
MFEPIPPATEEVAAAVMDAAFQGYRRARALVPRAAPWAIVARSYGAGHSASGPVSLVRMRTASCKSETKILPSPI